MGQILVRGLDDKVIAKLKKRAKADGRSLQSEVRTILERAASEKKVDMATARKMVEEIQKSWGGRTFSDSTLLIREDRDR